ncbi:MAG: hypothetical protein WDZ51_04680 [Pirellulaceae bacterium]
MGLTCPLALPNDENHEPYRGQFFTIVVLPSGCGGHPKAKPIIETKNATMLDSNNPAAEHVTHAAKLLTKLKKTGQKMSVSPTAARKKMLKDSLADFHDLRQLAMDQFTGNVNYLMQTIDQFETAMRDLSELGNGQVTVDRRRSAGPCPVCNHPTSYMPKHGIVECRQCTKNFRAIHSKLDASEGFGTWAV